jgi:shikimate dehydrogenase
MTESSEPRACVVGWPIAHSRSPLIHGFWLRKLGLAGSYDRQPVPPGAFAEFAARIGCDGLVGANVTAPHKEAAYAACDKLTATAAELGAVNTLWREGDALWGDNTDVAGFLANLDEQAPDWRERADAAIVLGAGGAARAVVSGLLSRKIDKLIVVNRTLARAQSLADHFGGRVVARDWADLPAQLDQAGLLVNTTSLGMAGQPTLDIDLAPLAAGASVADIVYVPLETPLLAAARARGLRTVEGLGMLLHQAAPGFERWFGVRPKVTPELRALIEADVAQASERKP